MTQDNTITAESLGDFFRSVGKNELNAKNKMTKSV